MIVGQGWGQGSQHAQSLQSWFAHIPGLKVVMPTTPHDVKGMLISSVEDNNPVIFIEHRWLYNISGPVPEGYYNVPIGAPRIAREGSDVTIVATSYMVLEALLAADLLEKEGIKAEVIDVRTIRPLDFTMIFQSVHKTGRLIVADTGWKSFGFSAEVIAKVAEEILPDLKYPPQRVALPETPSPTTFALANQYFPRAVNIIAAANKLGLKISDQLFIDQSQKLLDVPDSSFTGPF
jgi:acetoin:2,6-dichlorophenolindophenol oxidoreductase subunit beta